ncbi:hypothetical protein COV82_04705 [Candidatus Peregrinibacteria bacterium CG11_big_fil_rev_8_21_14_0_20_46_8]|nr:MAG: hypothetical protein COV82_04705 [Candidatus Peregrinibacteria bacterium CG11_big_fil_rev_8_21_14_0_20_46_8]
MLFSLFNSDKEKKLDAALKKIEFVRPTEAQKNLMRSDILRAISTQHHQESLGFAHLVRSMKKIGAEVTPHVHFRAMLRQKLMAIAEFSTRNFTHVFARLFHNHRKLWTGSIAVFFAFTLIFNFALDVERADAQYRTVLEDVFGEVTIIRNGQIIKGEKQLNLRADDVVQTSEGSYAVIRYLDQSLTRLDEGTNVKISRLFIDSQNTSSTIVDVILYKGRIWTRVVNLHDESAHFSVRAQNTTAVAKKKAAFDVRIADDLNGGGSKVKVSAIENQVDVQVSTKQKLVQTTLLKGYSAETTDDNYSQPKINNDEDEEEEEREWIATNLVKDAEYIENVKEESKKQRLDKIPNVLQGAAESTEIALTFDDFDKQMKILDAALQKLPRAELLIERGRHRNATRLLQEFEAELQTSLAWIQKYDLQYPLKANALKRKMNTLLADVEKQLALLLPDDPAYDVKRTVSEAKVSVSSGWKERVQRKLDLADTMLEDARDLLKKGDKKRTAEQVELYSQIIADVAADVKDAPEENRDEVINEILERKAQELKTLEEISAPNADEPLIDVLLQAIDPQADIDQKLLETSLQKTLSEAKALTLEKLSEAIIEAQKQPAADEAIQKIEDVELNGKQLLDVELSPTSITIQSGGDVVNVRQGE